MKDINLEELSEFLVKAKANTYASKESKRKILEDGTKEFTFKNGLYKYRDRYLGFDPFIGEEIVWYDKEAIWGMNYYGRIVSPNNISSEEIYGFLRKALMRVKKFAPFRGLPLFVENNFKYANKWEGDITKFKGEENIFSDLKNKVYTLGYQGGLIETKD